jgi:hypothetical protein
MRRLSTMALSIVSVLVLAVAAPTVAQQKSQLVGTWTLVSSDTTRQDGSSQWGSNPKGFITFTDNGRFSSQTMRSDRPKFASNNRLTGTADEIKAAMHGSIASYGTYSVDEAQKTYTLRIDGSTYPNLEGTSSTRPFTIVGDELRVTNPAPTTGGPASKQVFKRTK